MTSPGSVWGVNPGPTSVVFAVAHAGQDGLITIETLTTASTARHGQRLGWLDRQLRIYARQLAGSAPPVAVWVNAPDACRLDLSLAFTVGVTQAALSEALAEVPVGAVPPATWRSGRTWGARAERALGGQQEADAFCVAATARAVLLADVGVES